MQPATEDNQADQTTDNSSVVSAVPPVTNDAYTTDSSNDTPPAVSSAMSDALAATAAASVVAGSTDASTPSTNDNPIFGPTPASTATANDPLANNSTAPASTPAPASSELAINSSVDALVSEPTVVNTEPELASPLADPSPVIASTTSDDNSLISLKQQALQQLSPLVNHLDQSPEEKFKTTMMMLQATDDATLVQQAYTAAQAIPDEKSRAQALLDVVNEINYFTHQQSSPDQPPVFGS